MFFSDIFQGVCLNFYGWNFIFISSAILKMNLTGQRVWYVSIILKIEDCRMGKLQ